VADIQSGLSLTLPQGTEKVLNYDSLNLFGISLTKIDPKEDKL
jgi:hypothetical protein